MVATKRLAKGQLAATAGAAVTTTVYTVPVGETAIVKEIVLHAPDGAMAPGVYTWVTSSTTLKVWSPALQSGETQRYSCWFVLPAGEELLLVQPANVGRLRYWVSGTELDGVAD